MYKYEENYYLINNDTTNCANINEIIPIDEYFIWMEIIQHIILAIIQNIIQIKIARNIIILIHVHYAIKELLL